MKTSIKKTLIVIVIMMVAFLCADFNGNDVHSYTHSPPTGQTGAPGEGKCSPCHAGAASVTSQDGWITSNLGSKGYVPGMTYTISATATHPNSVKFGFQISPRFSSGALAGSMGLINATATQLLGSGKFIAHTKDGVSGSAHSRTWNFTWKAPVSGSGTVTFYGSFNCSNNNGSSSGDIIYSSKLVINESTIGIAEDTNNEMAINIFPNPATDFITINYVNAPGGELTISLYDLQGKQRIAWPVEYQPAGEYQRRLDISDLEPGIYFLHIKNQEGTAVKKIVRL